MQTSEAIDKISPAVVKAQSELKHAIKDSENGAFKQGGKASKYADLTAVWDAAKGVLAPNKLAALQDVVCSDSGVGVRTRLLHESGQWIEFDPPMIPLEKRTAHGVGSALTYGRRFSLSAALGVVADSDDDGNAASQSNGSGVADAQSTTQFDKVKNAPGISEAKTWAREHIRDLENSENGGEFLTTIESVRGRWAKVCAVYPNLWQGPDGSGLRGEGTRLATTFQCRQGFDAFLKEVEALAYEIKNAPAQAAQ